MAYKRRIMDADPASLSAATLLLGLTAAMALVPATIMAWRRAGSGWLFWCLHLAALAGCGAALGLQLALGWSPRLGLAMWLSLVVVLSLYPFVAGRWPQAVGLAPLIYPYLLLVALLAALLPPSAGGTTASGVNVTPWLSLHIVLALAAYGLASLAGLAALSVFLQELALKRRRPGRLSQRLPALADAEGLEFALLVWAECLLAAAIASGMAHDWLTTGQLLHGDHKTILALAAFAVIGLLLLFARRLGIRGRRAARVVLLAYLLLTLAYPGVKFVTELLID